MPELLRFPNAGRFGRADLTAQSGAADEVTLSALFDQLASVSGTDTQALGTDETGVLATALPATDAQALATDETLGTLVPIAASDAQALGTSEAALLVTPIAGTDTQALGTSEAASVDAPTSVAGTDTQALATVEAASVAVAVAATDTQAISTTDTGSLPAPPNLIPGAFAAPNAGHIDRAALTPQPSGALAAVAADAFFPANPNALIYGDDTQAIGTGELVARPIAQFVDPFNDGDLDTGGEWALSYTDPDVAVSETANVLTITPATSLAGSNYAGLYSTRAWRLTGSAAVLEVVQVAANASAESYVNLWSATQSDSRFQFRATGTTLQARKRVAGIDTLVSSAPYNATTHRWWRITESGGTVTWATSPDGATWTAFATDATGQVQTTAVYVDIGAGTFAATTVSPMRVGGLNAAADPDVTAAAGSDTQAFGTDETGALHAYLYAVNAIFGEGIFGSSSFGDLNGDNTAIGTDETGSRLAAVAGSDTQALGTSETAVPSRADAIADAQAFGTDESASVLAPVTQLGASDTQALGTDESAVVAVQIVGDDEQLFDTDEGYDLVSPTLIYGDDDQAFLTGEDGIAAFLVAASDAQAFGTDDAVITWVPISGSDAQAIGTDESAATPSVLVFTFDQQAFGTNESLGRLIEGETFTEAFWARGGLRERPLPLGGGLTEQPEGVATALQERPQDASGGLADRPPVARATLRERPDAADGGLTERPPLAGGALKER